jgi:hypothetical protein
LHSDVRERRRFEVKVALDPQPERPTNALKVAVRGVTQLVAVRPERGAAESEKKKVAVRLAAPFQNVERVSIYDYRQVLDCVRGKI